MTDTQYTDLPDVPEASGGASTAAASKDDVFEAMKDVVDPELGINVVDLGLVYDVHLDEHSNAVLDMTLTSAACPLTDVIQARRTLVELLVQEAETQGDAFETSMDLLAETSSDGDSLK